MSTILYQKITTNSNTREECLRKSYVQMFLDGINSTYEHAYAFD